MQRRHFLRSSGGAALALAGLGRHAEALADTRLRVGLIGCGWYGKSALFRLLQVAPAQVVSLCDVDRAMLEKTGQMVAARQASKATPRLYGDYRKMLAERDLGGPDFCSLYVLIRNDRPTRELAHADPKADGKTGR